MPDEKSVVGKFPVAELQRFFPEPARKHIDRQPVGDLLGGDSDGPAGFRADEGGGEPPEIFEFQRPIAQSATGHPLQRIRQTAVGLHEDDESAPLLQRIVDAELFQASYESGVPRLSVHLWQEQRTGCFSSAFLIRTISVFSFSFT